MVRCQALTKTSVEQVAKGMGATKVNIELSPIRKKERRLRRFH